jgi:hypothetical protein
MGGGGLPPSDLPPNIELAKARVDWIKEFIFKTLKIKDPL